MVFRGDPDRFRFAPRLAGARLRACVALAVVAFVAPAWGEKVVLRDQRVLRGKTVPIATAGSVAPPADAIKSIQLVDDDLRRVFIPRVHIAPNGILAEVLGASVVEKFSLRQQVASAGRTVKVVGPLIRVTPFDDFGRRTVTMNAAGGPVSVVQGITLITPSYVKVEGLDVPRHSTVWDMRLSTSSIPPAQLSAILAKQTKRDNLEDRKRIARLYLQMERYEQAAQELQGVLADFGGNEQAKKELSASLAEINQLAAKRLVSELALRREAGQHRMVRESLEHFPVQGASGETLQEVREMVRGYAALDQAQNDVLAQLQGLIQRIEDPRQQRQAAAVLKDIKADLSLATLPRLAAFEQAAKDPALAPADKVALALTGWFLESKGASRRLALGLSLARVRDLVQQYFETPDRIGRTRIIGQMQSETAGDPAIVVQLLRNMRPPVDTPRETADESLPLELKTRGLEDDKPLRYLVQLPPEYDPLRRYGTVVTLHGEGGSPRQQIDWWAGPAVKGRRLGQASRHGYIVIAPDWTAEHQAHYSYSAREHAAVLNCLRDACRRFSVDTDRVFLSGHSMGGDAAWDVGLAHPDLWAGVIPIAARSDKYCGLLWQNAALVPWYFVIGELDPHRGAENARDWDRYFRAATASGTYNVTVVEYQGRGRESFYDEILRLFEWMNPLRRNFFPREFTVGTLRPWDNYFWWVELEQLPSRAMVDPSEWPAPRSARPVPTTAAVNKANGFQVTSGAGRVIVWLSPEMHDLSQRLNVRINGRLLNTLKPPVAPDLETLLEDARTRGDRQHPFWVKLEAGRGGGR